MKSQSTKSPHGGHTYGYPFPSPSNNTNSPLQDYDPTRTTTERRFVQRLDCYLLTILSLGYFIKNLDSTNIGNAYVSGMKESLSLHSNQLNLIDAAWTTGYVTGQLPSQLLLTKVRPSIWIPSCELVWTLLTFSLAAASSANQVIAIRFFVGLVESIFYPAAHFLLGSWYKPSELGKRAAIFHASSAAAGMFSGYLQAGVYKGFNGTLGKEGWQWLFIMDGLISLPICITGFFLIPDLPENTRAFYLSSTDVKLARKRMEDVGRAPRRKLGWGIVGRVGRRWHVYALTILYIVFINTGPSGSVNPLSLWLKSRGWSVAKIVCPPVPFPPSPFYNLHQQLAKKSIINKKAEYHTNRPKPSPTHNHHHLLHPLRFPPQPPARYVNLYCPSSFPPLPKPHPHPTPTQTNNTQTLGLLSSLPLAIWTIPTPLKWTAYFLSRAAIPYGPLSMSWANEICGSDAEERALVLGIMNASGYAVHTWLPLLT